MKELYKPVFWCGFALSLSALYASSEKIASGENAYGRNPVLMQINIGKAISGKIDSQSVESSQLTAGESMIPAPEISEAPIPIEIHPPAETAPTTIEGSSVFFSAAQEVLGRK